MDDCLQVEARGLWTELDCRLGIHTHAYLWQDGVEDTKRRGVNPKSYLYSYSIPTKAKGLLNWSKVFSRWSSTGSGSQGRVVECGHGHAVKRTGLETLF